MLVVSDNVGDSMKAIYTFSIKAIQSRRVFTYFNMLKKKPYPKIGLNFLENHCRNNS